MRVLDIGPIEEIDNGTLETKVTGPGDELVRQVKGMADPNLTNPSMRFVPHRQGKVNQS